MFFCGHSLLCYFAAYLYNTNHECVRPITELATQCESLPALDAATYYTGFRVITVSNTGLAQSKFCAVGASVELPHRVYLVNHRPCSSGLLNLKYRNYMS